MLAWLRRRVAPQDRSIHIPVYVSEIARDFRRDTLEPSTPALMRGTNTALERSTTMHPTTAPSATSTYADIEPGDFVRVGISLVIATGPAELFRAGGIDAFRIPAMFDNGDLAAPVAGPRSDTFRRSTLNGRTIHTLIA